MIIRLLFRIFLLLQKKYDNFDPNLVPRNVYIIDLTWTIRESKVGESVVLKQHTTTINYVRNEILQYVNLRKCINNFIDTLTGTIDSVERF